MNILKKFLGLHHSNSTSLPLMLWVSNNSTSSRWTLNKPENMKIYLRLEKLKNAFCLCSYLITDTPNASSIRPAWLQHQSNNTKVMETLWYCLFCSTSFHQNKLGWFLNRILSVSSSLFSTKFTIYVPEMVQNIETGLVWKTRTFSQHLNWSIYSNDSK